MDDKLANFIKRYFKCKTAVLHLISTYITLLRMAAQYMSHPNIYICCHKYESLNATLNISIRYKCVGSIIGICSMLEILEDIRYSFNYFTEE